MAKHPDEPSRTKTTAAQHDFETRLADAKRGQVFCVDAVVGDDAMADRLLATGFWAGALVELLTTAPFGGPMLFKLHGFRVALRRNEAVRVRAHLAEDVA